MQWLRTLARRRFNHSDRGASAVIVALMMVPIMILAALAIDIAAMHANKQQLQTGADAGALAIAQDCARGDCSTTDDTAETMAEANLNGPNSIDQISTEVDETSGDVVVQTSSVQDHWFAPIIGINSSPVQAQSSARWGYPTGGTAVMPLTFSWCELEDQIGITVLRDAENNVTGVDIPDETPEVTLFNKGGEQDHNCHGTSGSQSGGSSGNVVPGGFRWVVPGPGGCGKTESVIGGWVRSDTGNNVPSGCTKEHFEKWVGKTVLLPIFDRTNEETGNNAQYQVFGYAAFTLSGFYFGQSVQHPSPAPCRSPDRCIKGSFDRFVDLTEDFDYSPSGPRLGAAVVALTE
ncbi:pilus assembly protein TadG-related protein [Nesterenkonia sp. LB17]|uniref:TadE/TadG family type IV pilus assembly protein n=1 Tax=Nesterenkonia sp. LB17 TaxID=2901230 RepID=UPI001F4CA536|nr:TadE/TadG family type IV pilus assembly protein [Nesterenkonia sp. LB17]MCH8566098.1 pilus assembly protein TadG-related protein [Nesterenkonia sp. LB17]